MLSKHPFQLPSWFIYSSSSKDLHIIFLFMFWPQIPKFKESYHKSFSKRLEKETDSDSSVSYSGCSSSSFMKTKKLKGIESGTDPFCNMKYVEKKKGKMVWRSARRKTALNQTRGHKNPDWQACSAGCMYACVCVCRCGVRRADVTSSAARPLQDEVGARGRPTDL